MFDVIIIGAGMAGLTAGIYVARAGKKVLVLESGAIGGQIIHSSEIENWPGDYGVSGADLMEKIYHQANNLGAEIKYEEVLSIAEKSHDVNKASFVVKTDSDEYSCNAVIIATGTEPKKLGKEQTEEVGDRPISYCAICDGALYKGKPVAVVGEGNTAKHEMKYLEGICSKVYNVRRGEAIPEEAEAIFVAIGRVPVTEKFSDLVELDNEGYVVAGEDCKTSCPGVFVAGDCRTKSIRQLVTAAGDAAVAALAALEY